MLQLTRLILLFAGAGVGYYSALLSGSSVTTALEGLGIGLFVSLLVISLETRIRKERTNVIIGGFMGLILSLIIANLFIHSLAPLSLLENSVPHLLITLFITILLGYIGITLGSKKIEYLDMLGAFFFRKEGGSKNIKIFDTSVIIDGRIADICETGFLEGEFIIPQFVLRELQQVADSSDSLKRTRGRRGLDILQRMQKNVDFNIKIIDDDFPKEKEVDAKLVLLSQKLNGKVITNDFNLNKVAELQGVSVLNINQLANAVKPVVLPGELMNVHIVKEGKEHGQGVAYLDDGTMVVVDNAKREIGKGVEVMVTSVLQTTAGRMIFTKLKGDHMLQEMDL